MAVSMFPNSDAADAEGATGSAGGGAGWLDWLEIGLKVYGAYEAGQGQGKNSYNAAVNEGQRLDGIFNAAAVEQAALNSYDGFKNLERIALQDKGEATDDVSTALGILGYTQQVNSPAQAAAATGPQPSQADTREPSTPDNAPLTQQAPPGVQEAAEASAGVAGESSALVGAVRPDPPPSSASQAGPVEEVLPQGVYHTYEPYRRALEPRTTPRNVRSYSSLPPADMSRSQHPASQAARRPPSGIVQGDALDERSVRRERGIPLPSGR